MTPEEYDARERILILKLHEEHPELPVWELIERVKQITRPEYFKLLKVATALRGISEDTRDELNVTLNPVPPAA